MQNISRYADANWRMTFPCGNDDVSASFQGTAQAHRLTILLPHWVTAAAVAVVRGRKIISSIRRKPHSHKSLAIETSTTDEDDIGRKQARPEELKNEETCSPALKTQACWGDDSSSQPFLLLKRLSFERNRGIYQKRYKVYETANTLHRHNDEKKEGKRKKCFVSKGASQSRESCGS